MSEVDYKKKCEEYERRIGLGEFDPAKDGYLVLVEILRQQNTYLGKFKVETFIASDDKANMTAYKNAKELWENLPDMIKKINNLKLELKMEGEEKKSIYSPISAKEIANGNV